MSGLAEATVEPRVELPGHGSGARSRAPWLGRLGLLHPRTRWPVLIMAVTVALMALERVALVVAMPTRFANAGVLEVLQAFAVGLRFDLLIGAMLAVLPLIVLAFAQPRLIQRRWFRRALMGYGGAVVALLVMLCLMDFFFMLEFGQRLNQRVFQYVMYDYIWLTLLAQYPVLPAVLVILLAGIGGGRLLGRWGFDDRYNAGRAWQGVLWPIVMGALLALLIRGGVGPKPINTGPAFFSRSALVTQLALNGPFTLREAAASHFLRARDLNEMYELLPRDQAFAVAQQTLRSERDRFLGDGENPLRRTVETDKPRERYNVVLVVMESMSWQYVESMGGREGLTPNLDRLARQGIFMDRCFAVGERTTRGFTALIGGFPDLPGDSVSTRAGAEHDFATLGRQLSRRGYETMFIYGGQPYYDHRQSFLGGNGFNRFVFEEDFATRTFRTDLGWCDGDLFRTAHQVFKSRDTGRPFFATLLTLTFHRPYTFPDGKIERVAPDHRYSDQLNAVRYTDWAIGQFIERAKQADYFENTIFVFTADHSGGFAENPPNPVSFRVPFLIYAPHIVGEDGRRISTVCSQTDVAPTILSLLGGTYEHTFFGSDVLSRPALAGRALIQPGDGSVVYVDEAQRMAIVPPFGREPRLMQFRRPDELTAVKGDDASHLEVMRMRAVSLLQAADVLYRQQNYNMGRAGGFE